MSTFTICDAHCWVDGCFEGLKRQTVALGDIGWLLQHLPQQPYLPKPTIVDILPNTILASFFNCDNTSNYIKIEARTITWLLFKMTFFKYLLRTSLEEKSSSVWRSIKAGARWQHSASVPFHRSSSLAQLCTPHSAKQSFAENCIYLL